MLWVYHCSRFSSTSSIYWSIRLNSALSINDLLRKERWMPMVIALFAAIRKKSCFLRCGRSLATKCGLQSRTYSAYPLVAFWLLNKPCYCGRRPDAKQKGAFSPLLLVSIWLRIQHIFGQIQCGLSTMVTTYFFKKVGKKEYKTWSFIIFYRLLIIVIDYLLFLRSSSCPS
jgi:hypothetical protein